MSTEFKDIAITGKPNTDQVRSGRRDWFAVFPFPISSEPLEEWIEIFKNECSSRGKEKLTLDQIKKGLEDPLQEQDERAWLNDYRPEISLDKGAPYILLECDPKALPLLSEYLMVDVTTTNRKYSAKRRAIREAVDKIKLP